MAKSQSRLLPILIVIGLFMIILAFCAGIVGAYLGVRLFTSEAFITTSRTGEAVTQTVSVVDQESAVIDVAANSSDSVVSIVVTKELPVYDDYFFYNRRRSTSTELQQIGAGTGFIISSDGLILTNRHVVEDEDATYTAILNDGSQLDAKVLGRDEVLDIAILQVDTDNLTALPLGDSDSIKVGQNVVAIGNSLGRFSNTVSSGIVSGVARSIVASDAYGYDSELLEGVIQTDASINPGNSGGPLLDIQGNVIGVNVAVAADAENIGFAIPINTVKPVIDSIQETGEIKRAFLGVRYVTLTPAIAEERDLSVTSGALVVAGDNGEAAITKNSAAEQAGLIAGDVITEINGIELDNTTSLQAEILKYHVDDQISITYLRDGQQQTVSVTLGEL